MPAAKEEGPDPTRMASLLSMSEEGAHVFEPEELAPILQHQLATLIECDMTEAQRDAAQRFTRSGSSADPPLETFADLLHHPQPPLELLEIAKEFAKANRNDPNSALPTEISTLLYYACIAVALVRRHRCITDLADDTLKTGFSWALDQTWVDGATAALFRTGRDALGVQEKVE